MVLSRLPEDRAALPQHRDLQPEQLPRVIRVTHALHEAQQTADRIRAAGGAALVMEDPADSTIFCTDHPVRLATGTCTVCGRLICLVCEHSAEGQPLCSEHASLARRRQQLLRVRQLFVLFLFTAFLYQVIAFVQSDHERVDPLSRTAVNVAVIQLIDPAALADTSGALPPIVAALNDPDGPYSLQQIAPWFGAERRRYTQIGEPYLRLTVLPPEALAVLPPALAGPDDPVWRVALASWRYLRYFGQLAAQQGIDEDLYGARVFVLYGDAASSDLAAHSRGSEKGRLAIAHVDTLERNPAYALTTIAHELGHALGAEDTYLPESASARHPEGFVEPFAVPLYPQRFAELMAVDIPLAADVEGEVRALSQVKVGHHTAAGMGWITTAQRDAFYAPPALRPEQQLEPLTRDPAPEAGDPAPGAPGAPSPDPGSGGSAPEDAPAPAPGL